MEGAHDQAVDDDGPDEQLEALLHLVRGLVREGDDTVDNANGPASALALNLDLRAQNNTERRTRDAHDVLRLDLVVLNEVRHSRSEHLRLACPTRS